MPLDPATQVFSVASSDDTIVPAKVAHAPGGENHTVRGTHSGLVVNASVYRLLGQMLAQRPTGHGA
jgi:hypothetical protein